MLVLFHGRCCAHVRHGSRVILKYMTRTVIVLVSQINLSVVNFRKSIVVGVQFLSKPPLYSTLPVPSGHCTFEGFDLNLFLIVYYLQIRSEVTRLPHSRSAIGVRSAVARCCSVWELGSIRLVDLRCQTRTRLFRFAS
jgi:hypothetical protein